MTITEAPTGTSAAEAFLGQVASDTATAFHAATWRALLAGAGFARSTECSKLAPDRLQHLNVGPAQRRTSEPRSTVLHRRHR